METQFQAFDGLFSKEAFERRQLPNSGFFAFQLELRGSFISLDVETYLFKHVGRILIDTQAIWIILLALISTSQIFDGIEGMASYSSGSLAAAGSWVLLHGCTHLVSPFHM